MFIFESRVLQIDYFSYNGPPTEYDGNGKYLNNCIAARQLKDSQTHLQLHCTAIRPL